MVSGGGVVTSGKKRLPAASCRLAKSLNLFNQNPAVKQVTSSKNGSCNNARVTDRVSTTARRKPNPQRRTTQHDSAGVREHRNEPSSSDCRTKEAHKWRSRFNIRTVPLSRLRQFVPALLERNGRTQRVEARFVAAFPRPQDLVAYIRSLNVSRRKKTLPCAKASFQLRVCHWHVPPNRALLRSPLRFSEGCHALGGHPSSLMLKTDLTERCLLPRFLPESDGNASPDGPGRRLFLLVPALSPAIVRGSKSSCQS